MAYPFIPFPTVSEFVAVAKEKYGYRVVKETVIFRGKPKTVFFLRKAEVKYHVHLPPKYSEEPDMRLTPRVIRSLCRRLKIPVKEWLPLE